MLLAQLLAAAVSCASAAEFFIPSALGSGGRFLVVTDRPPVWLAAGTPAFPKGTTMEIRADGRAGPLTVHLVAPTEQTEARQRGAWRKTFARPGGYMLEYGSELGMSGLSNLHFIVFEPDVEPGPLGAPLP